MGQAKGLEEIPGSTESRRQRAKRNEKAISWAQSRERLPTVLKPVSLVFKYRQSSRISAVLRPQALLKGKS